MSSSAAPHICLIRTSAIGDTVHALALVNALKAGWPKAQITWILQELPYEMVMHQPAVDQFITFNRKANYKEWLQLIKRIRQNPFDYVLTPQASSKAALLTLLSRAQKKIGFDWQRSREGLWLATNCHIPARPMQHVQDQFFEFAAYLGIEPKFPEWNFQFTAEETNWQRQFFAPVSRPVAGFVIASAHPEKDWPSSCYATVMDYAAAQLDLCPMIIGGPSQREKRLAEDITAQCHCSPIIALEKPIRHTMLQLQGCRLVVAPDTGPLHIAVAMGVPTIGLYGYSNPRRCGPYRFRDLLVDAYNDDEEADAAITRRTKPGRMREITPDRVTEKMLTALNHHSSDQKHPLCQ